MPTSFVNPIDFGAEGDGADDDTVELQAMLDAQLPGAPPITLTKRYFIGGQLNIPAGVRLMGGVPPGQLPICKTFMDFDGSLILGPEGRINLSEAHEATLEKILIISQDAAGARPETPDDAVMRIEAWTGTAIDCVCSQDVQLLGNLIIGFETAVNLYACNRPIIRDNKIDAHNGIVLTTCKDVPHIETNHLYLFWNIGLAEQGGDWQPTVLRRGSGIRVNDTDGAMVTSNLVYGHKIGLDVDGRSGDVFASMFRGNWIDNALDQQTKELDPQYATGIWTRGYCRICTFVDNHVNSHSINYVWNHDGVSQGVTCIGNTSGSAALYPRQFVSGDGTSVGFVSGGEGVAVNRVELGAGRWSFESQKSSNSLILSLFDIASGFDRTLFSFETAYRTEHTSPTWNPDDWGTKIRVVRTGSNQSVSALTPTLIAYNGETLDSMDEYSTAPNFAFTARMAGVYIMTLTTSYSPNATPAIVQLQIYKNGAPFRLLDSRLVSSGFAFTAPVIETAAVGDVFQAYVFSDQAGVIAAEQTYWEVYRLPLGRG